jgi:glycosyltransferase involved in cell wall biosynthesis
MKTNIVMFWFNDDWGNYGRAYERVAEHLANIDDIGHITCVFPPIRDSSDQYLRIRQVKPKLTLLTETNFKRFRLDRPFSRLRNQLNERLKERALRTYLRRIGYRKQNTVLWLFPPHHYVERLVKGVPHRLAVTHVIDNFTKFDSSHPLHTAARKQYPKLGEWSDIIVTTSQANQREFAETGRPCYLFYPAVDHIFIGQPEQPPHRITGAPPRLGYVGFIMDRTDLDLIAFVAKQRPQWRLVLAGPQYPAGYLDESGLLDLANVEYLGPVPQKEVPAFLRSLDICLMPHRDNEYSRSMGPLKLYQYLASGRPIVSTNVAGLERVREHILVANNREEFIEHIETTLQFDTADRSAERIEVAKKNTWPVRVREMFEIVQKHLDMK